MPDDVREVVALLQRALELHVFFAQPPALDSQRNLRDQFIVGPRLGDVVLRAILECGARHVDRAIRGDQNDRKLRIAPADFRKHLDAVAVRKAHVQQHQIERMIFDLLQAGLAGFRQGDLEAFRSEQRFQAFADFGFVVYDEDGAFRHGLLFWQQEIPAGTTCLCRAWSARPLFPRAP